MRGEGGVVAAPPSALHGLPAHGKPHLTGIFHFDAAAHQIALACLQRELLPQTGLVGVGDPDAARLRAMGAPGALPEDPAGGSDEVVARSRFGAAVRRGIILDWILLL